MEYYYTSIEREVKDEGFIFQKININLGLEMSTKNRISSRQSMSQIHTTILYDMIKHCEY